MITINEKEYICKCKPKAPWLLSLLENYENSWEDITRKMLMSVLDIVWENKHKSFVLKNNELKFLKVWKLLFLTNSTIFFFWGKTKFLLLASLITNIPRLCKIIIINILRTLVIPKKNNLWHLLHNLALGKCLMGLIVEVVSTFINWRRLENDWYVTSLKINWKSRGIMKCAMINVTDTLF